MRKRIIIWSLFGVLLVLIAGVLCWQANNLKAIRWAFYSPEEQQVILDEKQKTEQALLEALPMPAVTPLDEWQAERLQRGEISEDEALSLIMGKQPDQTGKDADSPILQEKIARVYLLQASFSGKLDGLLAEAKQEYIAQGGKNKLALAKKYMGKGFALEGECDAQMNTLLAEIEAELKRIGGDVSLVSEIRAVYKSEKSAKKAALLSYYRK